jgi:hypothetical protein
VFEFLGLFSDVSDLLFVVVSDLFVDSFDTFSFLCVDAFALSLRKANAISYDGIFSNF